MAFAMNELSLMAYTGAVAGGNHEYRYANSEGDDVAAANFFDGAAHMIRAGDTIYDQDGAVIYTVATVADGVVTVAPIHDAPA